MKQCPRCKRELKDDLVFCPLDGEPLGVRIVTDEFVGILLDDKYRLEEKVGKGGMGTVYRATHIQMENTVAVKILHPLMASDQTALERFRREARSTAQIRHPNAVAVTDFGVTRDTGIAYLVMEFLEGQDLRQRIRERRQLDLEETASILNQTCSAVSAAHLRGIIHRDLKPDNIWLIKTEKEVEQVKVLDFGIAKLNARTDDVSLTQGAIIGTPYYMSPEQCRGETLDFGSDVYSLGVILYEMLTGRVPFDGSNPLAVVLKHSTEQPRPLRELRPDIPEPVDRVVLRALEKNREDRPTSAEQLAQEFDAALPSEGGTRKFGSSVAVQPAAPITSDAATVIVDPAFHQALAGVAPQRSSGIALGSKPLFPVDASATVETRIAERGTLPSTRSLNPYLIAAIAIVFIAVIAVGIMSMKSQSESISRSIYRVRTTVVDPQGMPVEDAKVWSSIGGEPKKVAGGWQFDIPVGSKPAGGEITVYASKENAFLAGKQDIQLRDDLNPALNVALVHDASASVIGYVRDREGRAISGARVSIGGNQESVFSGASGNFLVPAHAAINEPVLIRVEKQGFSSAELWHPAGEHAATVVLERR